MLYKVAVMGLFNEVQHFGGEWVRNFVQGKDDIIEKFEEQEPILHDGMCAAYGLHWVEYYLNTEDTEYTTEMCLVNAEKLIATQVYLRLKDISLGNLLQVNKIVLAFKDFAVLRADRANFVTPLAAMAMTRSLGLILFLMIIWAAEESSSAPS